MGWLIAALLAAGLAGGGWWWYQHRGANAVQAEVAEPGGKPGGRSGANGAKAGSRGGVRGGMGGAMAQPVSVGEVNRQDLRVRVSAIGSMSARATAVVRAKVSGELTAIKFQEGEEVKAGALLATIDARSYEAALGQVRGALTRDEALLANARIDLTRYRDLQAKNSIASQQVDTQAALVRQLEGTAVANRAASDAAKLQLSYTRITAPISGRLGLRQADRGNVVAPGDANGIVTITQVRPIDAVFSVPEAFLPQITPRLNSGRAMPIELWDREMGQRLGVGTVSALDNAIDAATGSIRIKAAFANDDGALFPNQFVNVLLELNTLKDVLTVPVTALQNKHVYVVQADGAVAYTPVKVGQKDGERVSVEGALQPGAQVVTDGLDRLRDGTKVNVIVSVDARAGAARGRSDAAPTRRFDPASLPPAQRAAFEKMSSEERRAFVAARRAKSADSADSAVAGDVPPTTPTSPAAPLAAASGAARVPDGSSPAGTGATSPPAITAPAAPSGSAPVPTLTPAVKP